MIYIYLFKECSENLTEDEEVCEIMSPVEAIGKKSYQEVMVKQRSQPIDFSHLFNTIHGRRYQDVFKNRFAMNLSEQIQGQSDKEENIL